MGYFHIFLSFARNPAQKDFFSRLWLSLFPVASIGGRESACLFRLLCFCSLLTTASGSQTSSILRWNAMIHATSSCVHNCEFREPTSCASRLRSQRHMLQRFIIALPGRDKSAIVPRNILHLSDIFRYPFLALKALPTECIEALVFFLKFNIPIKHIIPLKDEAVPDRIRRVCYRRVFSRSRTGALSLALHSDTMARQKARAGQMPCSCLNLVD